MGALSPFITTIKKIVELLKMKMKFFQMLWTVLLWKVLLWTIVVDSFPVEQDNRDGRAGPASDLGDWRWQDSGYKEYLANRTEPPFRSPDCCVVEEIEWGPTWEEVMEGNYTDQSSGWEPPTVKPPAFEDLSLPVQWLVVTQRLSKYVERTSPSTNKTMPSLDKLGFQYVMQWAEDAYNNFPEAIASNLNTAWYENALTEYRKMEKLEAIPKYSPKDKDDDWEMSQDIGRMFT